MIKSFFFLTAAIIFIIGSTLHFLRLVFELDVYVGSWSIPGWFSGIIIILYAFMTYWSLKINRKEDQIKKERDGE